MNPWITVVGLTDRGLDGLPAATRSLIDGADILVGGRRHLAMVATTGARQFDWSDGLDPACEAIAGERGKDIVVLASGDPLNYGIGAKLVNRFGACAVHFIPAASAFSLAAARMGWSLPDVHCLTVHGRPLEIVHLHLAPGARLLVLSWHGKTPKALAELLVGKGFGESQITVLEHMEGSRENRTEGTASQWPARDSTPLNTIAVDCVAGPDAVYWPRVPGLPEAAYQHDGKITKREVRAATLAALAPLPGQTLWDVGAGSGAVGIEWMRVDTSNQTIAFEHDISKLPVITANAHTLGVPGLKLIAGSFLEMFETVPEIPDAIFVGGGVSNPRVLDRAWSKLRSGGRLVSNGVTIEAQRSLMDFHSARGGHLVRIGVARSGTIGPMTAMRPMMDVLQLAVEKP